MLRAVDVQVGGAHQLAEVPYVAQLDVVGRLLGEPLGGVLVDGLQHPVAGRPARVEAGHQQGLVDQREQQVGDLLAGHPGLVGADHLGVLQRPAAGEDRQPPQDGPFAFAEQVPAPVDDGAQGLLAGQQGAAAGGEQGEAAVQPVGDLTWRHHP